MIMKSRNFMGAVLDCIFDEVTLIVDKVESVQRFLLENYMVLEI